MALVQPSLAVAAGACPVIVIQGDYSGTVSAAQQELWKLSVRAHYASFAPTSVQPGRLSSLETQHHGQVQSLHSPETARCQQCLTCCVCPVVVAGGAVRAAVVVN